LGERERSRAIGEHYGQKKRQKRRNRGFNKSGVKRYWANGGETNSAAKAEKFYWRSGGTFCNAECSPRGNGEIRKKEKSLKR